MTREIISASILCSAMLLTGFTASQIKPTHYMSEKRGGIKISSIIPDTFGTWKKLDISTGIVNPQQKQLLDELYTELVTRTYVSSEGGIIMLSVAYGKNQNDSFQVHLPEICYPAQGFQVGDSRRMALTTPYGVIPIKQLETTFQSRRSEPVTYWTTLGNHAVKSGIDKKMKEISYAMQGDIADGLLFRISSIDSDKPRAFAMQQKFIQDMLASITAADRLRLAGLGE
jgi:EpsI family protein